MALENGCCCLSFKAWTLLFLFLALINETIITAIVLVVFGNVQKTAKLETYTAEVIKVSAAICWLVILATIIFVTLNTRIILALRTVIVLLVIEIIYLIYFSIVISETRDVWIIICLAIYALAFMSHLIRIFWDYMQTIPRKPKQKSTERNICCCMSVRAGTFFFLFLILFGEIFEVCWVLFEQSDTTKTQSIGNIIPGLIFSGIGCFIVLAAIVAVIMDESIFALRVVIGFLTIDSIYTCIIGIINLSHNSFPNSKESVFIWIILPFVVINLNVYIMMVFSQYIKELKHPTARTTATEPLV